MNIEKKKWNDERGMSLLEMIIGVAILTVVAVSVYQSFAVLLDVFGASQAKVAAAVLANEEMEIIRNIPYASVGTSGGVPSGSIPQSQTKTKNGITFLITTTIRNIDDPFDGVLGGTPNDLSPSDYKLVELNLTCTSCLESGRETFKFTARVAPRALETASTNGALFVQAFDANGDPISGANVQITNANVTPAINISDVTDATGFLRIVDVPPSIQKYRIIVSKSGYSSEQTYATSTQNPNPVKPDATVALQTATQVSFSIDKVATLNISSVTESCVPVPSIGVTVTGSKLIGTAPNVLKFNQSYTTDASGLKVVPNLEWDNYAITMTTGTYALRGTIPLAPLNILPNAAQDFKIIVAPQVARSLLVTVKDLSSGLPLSNATVHITGPSTDETLITGRGFLGQSDWSGGSGQTDYTNADQYFDQDGNIDTASPAGELKLLVVASSTYAASGVLTSSTFDTGSPSTFYTLSFNPQSAPPQTGTDSVKFQFASATTTAPASWNYLGPDGTSGTYYTTSNGTINAIHTGDQYFRYRAFLSTASTTFTPNVSDFAVTFASSCVPPGQVFFSGLPSGTYSISIQRSGYQAVNDITTINQSWQEYVAQMSP